MKVRKLMLAVAAIGLQLSIGAAHGAEADLKLDDARTLLGLMHFDAQLDDALKQCQDMTKTITPESLYQSNPTQFGGLEPGSRFWPAVVAAFQEFYYTTCSYIDHEAFTTAAAQSWRHQGCNQARNWPNRSNSIPHPSERNWPMRSRRRPHPFRRKRRRGLRPITKRPTTISRRSSFCSTPTVARRAMTPPVLPSSSARILQAQAQARAQALR